MIKEVTMTAKQAELIPAADALPAAPVVNQDGDPWVAMFERLAVNPAVDVEKLERLFQLRLELLRQKAEGEFNAAFAAMQADIPTIIERAKTDKTTYAPLEDINEKVMPVLQRHGFSLSHRTEWPTEKTVKVIGILTHAGGHKRESEFVSGADQTGSKNGIQALGSAVMYGRRYTTKDLLNIVTRGEDDDGAGSERPAAPEGFDPWLDKLKAWAVKGMPALMKFWNESPAELRQHVTRHYMGDWRTLREQAGKVKAGA